MALSQAAAKLESVMGHRENAVTEQDVTNPARNRAKYGHPTETMKACIWAGKNTVEMGTVNTPSIGTATIADVTRSRSTEASML